MRESTDTRLTAGLIGCGPRGESHARSCAAPSPIELVACADIDLTIAASFARRHGIAHYFDSVDQLMRTCHPELVQVATPPAVRRSVIDRVLGYRPKAVLVEKPLALEPDEAHYLLDRCRAEQVALFVNHQLRYFRPLRLLRRHLATGVLGTVHTVVATTRCDVLEQGSHLFDMVGFLLGDQSATQVFAAAQGTLREGPTAGAPRYLAGVATYEQGTRLYFECGAQAPAWPGNANPWHQMGVELIGDRGHAGVSLNRGWWVTAGNHHLHGEHEHELEDDPAQRRLLADIPGALEDPDTHPCGPRRSLNSLRLIFAAQRSALTGLWTPADQRVTNAEITGLRNHRETGAQHEPERTAS